MKAYVIKKGKKFQQINNDEFYGSLKSAELFPTREIAKRYLEFENEKIVSVEISEIK